MTVVEEIAAERKRQIEAESWSVTHDNGHYDRSLAQAAAAYAFHASLSDDERKDYRYAHKRYRDLTMMIWPRSWATSWWKPKDRRRDLIRAAALIVAEIERLDRAATEADDGS